MDMRLETVAYISFVGNEVRGIWKVEATYLAIYKQAIVTTFA